MCNAHERSKILDLTLAKQLTRKEAAKHLGLSSRQLRRILKCYKQHGLPGLISNKKGVVGRIGYSDELKHKVINLYTSKYPDFGPTFAAEKLLELDGIKISFETLRQWLVTAGKWSIGRTKEPAKSINMHTPLSQYESSNIDLWLTKQFKKKVTKNMTVQHNNIVYFIKTTHKLLVRRTGVILVGRLNGHVDFLYRDKPNDHKVLGRKNQKMGLVLNRTEANDAVNKILFMKTEPPAGYSADAQG